MKSNLRIVFMGTPDFATASLRGIIESGYNVVGVVTAPDKRAGRGRQLNQSSVKRFAIENQLFLLQPQNLKDQQFIADLKLLKADIQVVVAFRKLPKVVWDMPPLGTFNLHASLLPKYRGAAPINWAVINGEKQSGVTTFFIEEDIDTGNIILQKEIDIDHSDNAGTLHDKLMKLGSHLVIDTLNIIGTKGIESKKQTGKPTHAPKIFKADCKINWSDELMAIHQKIKGLSPYPTAWTNISENKTLKIFDSSVIKTPHNFDLGTIITDDKKELKVAVKGGFITILEVQLSGKKRMKVAEFLRGFRFEKNTLLF